MTSHATTVCPICGCTRPPEVITPKEMVQGLFEEFHYGYCTSCGVLWLLDPPADMSKYYDDYYSLKTKPSALRSGFAAKVMEKIANATLLLRNFQLDKFKRKITNKLRDIFIYNKRFATRAILRNNLTSYEAVDETYFSLNTWAMFGLGIKPGASILDYGSGTGRFVLEMSQLGFPDTMGLDPFLEQDLVLPTGAKVLRGDLSTLSPTDKVYDVITMHHAFEHIPEPFACARQLADLLAQNGVLVLRFPHIGSYHFKQYRQHWWGIHAPRHFFLHSQKSLEIVFGQAGLEIFHVKCDSQFEHYLYSQEYQLDIANKSPFSIRSENGGIFTKSDILYWKKKAVLLNRALVGDWVVYYLRHKQ